VNGEATVDGTHLRHQAAVLAELAGQARDAGRTASACAGVVWSSLAADRFREALMRQARWVHSCADLLDEASAALAAHAIAVDPGARSW
jgi:hypothetical protein